MMKALSGHPNSIEFMDYFIYPTFSVIVMERPVNFQDLFTYNANLEKPMPEYKARNIACQLGRVLFAAEHKHIVHRDIKNENILFDPVTGQIKLIDYGFATKFKPGQRFDTFSGKL